jgi:hypothetical protein
MGLRREDCKFEASLGYRARICLKTKQSWAPLAHTRNPSYSGGRDQEDPSSKPSWAKSSLNPILKKPITKKGLEEWLKVKAQSSSPSTTKQNKKFTD